MRCLCLIAAAAAMLPPPIPEGPPGLGDPPMDMPPVDSPPDFGTPPMDSAPVDSPPDFGSPPMDGPPMSSPPVDSPPVFGIPPMDSSPPVPDAFEFDAPAEEDPLESKLPKGWVKEWSKRENKYYYFNRETGKSQFHSPNDPDPVTATRSPTEFPTKSPTPPPTKFPTERSADCVVSDWSAWTACSKSCGAGVEARTRRIIAPAHGGTPCPELMEQKDCNLHPENVPTPGCPAIDCAVGKWSAWNHCSKSCGGGVTHRIREKLTPAAHGGAECPKLVVQKKCNTDACPTPSPTNTPTKPPTASPTETPTKTPTKTPTPAPTFVPTAEPTSWHWEENVHNKTGREFVYNTKTGESRWHANPTTNPTSIPTTAPTYSPTAAAGYIRFSLAVSVWNNGVAAAWEKSMSDLLGVSQQAVIMTRKVTRLRRRLTVSSSIEVEAVIAVPTVDAIATMATNIQSGSFATEMLAALARNAPWLDVSADSLVVTGLTTEVTAEGATSFPTKSPTSSPTTLSPTKSPTGLPTAAPTIAPTPHPCDDGTHGCEKGTGGICYKLEGNNWSCDCDATLGFMCAYGCAAPHVSHRCKLTVAPTTYPTKYPTKYPTPKPTRTPTTYPTSYPTPTPTATPTTSPTPSHKECAKTRCSYLKLENGLHRTAVYRYQGDTERYHCEYLKGHGKNNCKCWCDEELECTLVHHHDAGYKKKYHWSEHSVSHC